VGSLVTVLLQISPDFYTEKKVDNWSIFDEVIRRTKANFWATLQASAFALLF